MRWRVAAWGALLAVAAVVQSPAAALSPAELNDLSGEANALFRQANQASLRDPAAAGDLYLRAALRFERIVEEGGIRNGRLFYNIANAYFQTDDIGRAILNYRRAELFMSSDPNLRQNLAYARSRRSDSFEEKQETQVLKTLLFWHYDISPAVRSLLLAIFSGVFWIAAGVRLLGSRWAPRTVLLVSGIVAALLLGSLAVEAAVTSRQEAGVVLSQQVVARKGDGASYEPSFEDPLHAGTEFLLIETRGDWRHIELPDGRRCWIPAKSADLVSRL